MSDAMRGVGAVDQQSSARAQLPAWGPTSAHRLVGASSPLEQPRCHSLNSRRGSFELLLVSNLLVHWSNLENSCIR